MRIIAGSARGRRLKAPDTDATRPATDRVREAVFSSIGSWVEDADVADLYAGTGSFGLEALSRGARSAVFVENARKALAVLKDNIETLGLGGTLVSGTVVDYLNRSKDLFDLVFMDPAWPLETEQMEVEMTLLDRLLRPDGEVVVSRRHTDRIPSPPKTWRLAAEKLYGDTRILRYEKVKQEQ